jgi:hypothetical protein
MFWDGVTYPFVFVVGRMIYEPMESTSTDVKWQPHRVSLSSKRAATQEHLESSFRVLDATKVHDCSMNRLRTLPETTYRREDKRSIRLSELQLKLGKAGLGSLSISEDRVRL